MLKIVRYLLAFILVIVTLIIFISLVSFNYQDSSILFGSTNDAIVKNLLGNSGANISAILLYLFGVSSFFILPILFFNILFLINYLNYKEFRVRYYALIFFTITLTTLFNIYSIEIFSNIYPGGFIGKILKKIAFKILPQNFATSFLLMLLLALFIIIDRFSFVHYMGPLARVLNKALFKIFITIKTLTEFALKKIQTIFIFLIDKLTKDSEDQNQEIEEIYQDPFWEIYK